MLKKIHRKRNSHNPNPFSFPFLRIIVPGNKNPPNYTHYWSKLEYSLYFISLLFKKKKYSNSHWKKKKKRKKRGREELKRVFLKFWVFLDRRGEEWEWWTGNWRSAGTTVSRKRRERQCFLYCLLELFLSRLCTAWYGLFRKGDRILRLIFERK